MIPISEAVRLHFHTIGARDGLRGPMGEIIAILASGEYDPVAFAEVCAHFGVGREGWFRSQLLNLVVEFLADPSDAGLLPADLLRDASALKRFLHIKEGEFLRLKSKEVAAILGAQLDGLLADGEITESEDLYQVQLQELFDLSYDQYVMLIRPAVERAWLRLQTPAMGEFGSEARRIRLQEALRPLHELAQSQPRTLGAFY